MEYREELEQFFCSPRQRTLFKFMRSEEPFFQDLFRVEAFFCEQFISIE